MHPHYFKSNPFPMRPEDIMQDDNPPLSLNEQHMLEAQELDNKRLKDGVLGLISILK